METIKDLIVESPILRGSIAIVLIIGSVYMVVNKVTIPDWYIALLNSAMLYFFVTPSPQDVINNRHKD